MREEWAGIENHFLVERGIAAVDHRSLETQGVDRDPEPKLGVAAKAMERRGLKTERGASVREWESQRAAKVERVAVPEQAAANDSPARLGIEKPRHAQTRLEREAEQLESWRTQKLSQLSARQSDDWDTLQARQASQTAAHTTQMQEAHGQYRADQLAQIQALTERLQANGVRRLVGRVSGAQAADREALAALRATVRNGRWRERVATQALCQEQESERAQRLAEHRAQFDAFKETIAGIRGLHGAKRFDQAERSRLVVQGNEAALARFDRENPGVAPAVSVALAAERRAGLSGQFESSADMERGDRDHVRDPGQDFGLDR